jgi:hypothetical protein
MSDGAPKSLPGDPQAFQRIDSDFSCAVSFPWPNAAASRNQRPTPSKTAFATKRSEDGEAPHEEGHPAAGTPSSRMPQASAEWPNSFELAQPPMGSAPTAAAPWTPPPAYGSDGKRRPERRKGSRLIAGLPVGFAVVVGTMSIGYFMGGGELVLDKWPLIAHHTQPTRPSPSQTATNMGAPSQLSSRDASGAEAATAIPREFASGTPLDRPRDRPGLSAGQPLPAQMPPSVTSLPMPAANPPIGRSEPAGATAAAAGLRFVGSPISLGVSRLTSQELREAGDEAYRRGDFSAATELYDRSQQMFDMEHPARAETLEVVSAPQVERQEPTAPKRIQEVVPATPPAVAPQLDQAVAALVPSAELSGPKLDAVPSPAGSSDTARLPPGTYAALMRNGDAAFERADISGARALYQRAASLDRSAAAAHVAAGKTYDPGILAGLGVRSGALADAAAAARWYERARSLGDPAAGELLSRLR